MNSYREIVRKQLEVDEGYRKFPYRCTAGKLSIGIGRNLEDKGVSDRIIEMMFQEDLSEAELIARTLFPSFDFLSENRKAVLVNMAFNLGEPRLAAFKKFRAAVEAKRWDDAAVEMEDSMWFRQVGDRAKRLQSLMERG